MPKKVSANIVGYNSKAHLQKCLEGVLAQDYPNLEVTFIDNNSADGSEDFIRQNFPAVKIIQTGRNAGYSGGHNIGIEKSDGEYVWVLTPDLSFNKDFLTKLVEALEKDEKIAGAQGKLLRPEPNAEGLYTFDSTGIYLGKSRRPFDRGQNDLDRGQYDASGEVFGLNGAAPLYKREALLDGAINGEIFDQDIFMYWDDIDLCWRLRAMGWKLWYEASAVGHHGRAAGASPGGYRKPLQLIKHRRQISFAGKKWSLKNNILVLLKNDAGWPAMIALPKVVVRQILIFGYAILIEPKTLAIIPQMFSQIPAMLKKRRFIARNRRVSAAEVAKWFK